MKKTIDIGSVAYWSAGMLLGGLISGLTKIIDWEFAITSTVLMIISVVVFYFLYGKKED